MKLLPIVPCVLAALLGAPGARATDFHYVPPTVTEYYFSGNFGLDGDVDATGADLGATPITLAFEGIGGPDTLTWTHMYLLKVGGVGPGFRATSSTDCDIDFLTLPASTPPGGAKCDVELTFLTPRGQPASRVWKWTDVGWFGTAFLIEEDDILGRLDGIGCIGGFTIKVTMKSGSVSIAQMSLGWEAGSIEPCPVKGDAIFDTGPGQRLLIDQTGSGMFVESWHHWLAGATPTEPQSWQLQAINLKCVTSTVKGFDLFYEEIPAAPFDKIQYRIWDDASFTLVRQASLDRVDGIDDPLTPGADTLLHQYQIDPLELKGGKYWFTAFAEGDPPAYFGWRTNALDGAAQVGGLGPFGYHSSAYPTPGFVMYQVPPPMVLKPLTAQNGNHLYNAAFRLRGLEIAYADCDKDGDRDIFDFLCFQNQFAGKTPYADCEKDGKWDVFDFLCFQNKWALGCEVP